MNPARYLSSERHAQVGPAALRQVLLGLFRTGKREDATSEDVARRHLGNGVGPTIRQLLQERSPTAPVSSHFQIYLAIYAAQAQVEVPEDYTPLAIARNAGSTGIAPVVLHGHNLFVCTRQLSRSERAKPE